MKLYTIHGKYNGLVMLKMRAGSYAEALKAFMEDCGEDSIEVMEPSQIGVIVNTLKVDSE